jgi:hypothetical protein
MSCHGIEIVEANANDLLRLGDRRPDTHPPRVDSREPTSGNEALHLGEATVGQKRSVEVTSDRREVEKPPLPIEHGRALTSRGSNSQ